MASQHSTTADFSSRYKFNGKELDRETGWYYYGARYYDPQVSMWLSVDKLTEHPNQLDKNSYVYVWNNPVNLNDPDGKCPWCIVGAIVGAAVDYGIQVATNYAEGKTGTAAWTDNINVTSIVTSAAEGFVTGGESSLGNLAKFSIKAGSVILNNTVEINTSKGVKVEKNLYNIEKNIAIDVVSGKSIDKLGKYFKKKTIKSVLTNKGNLNRTSKNILKKFGKHVTRARTMKYRYRVKKVGKAVNIINNKTLHYITIDKKNRIKAKTNWK